jgi:hypothetical protein
MNLKQKIIAWGITPENKIKSLYFIIQMYPLRTANMPTLFPGRPSAQPDRAQHERQRQRTLPGRVARWALQAYGRYDAQGLGIYQRGAARQPRLRLLAVQRGGGPRGKG